MGILLECFCTAERVFAPYANAWPGVGRKNRHLGVCEYSARS